VRMGGRQYVIEIHRLTLKIRNLQTIFLQTMLWHVIKQL
jgi:hypothetical protein